MLDLDEGERMASVLLADPWRPIVQSDNSIALINFSRDCTEAQARAFIDALRFIVNNAPTLIAELRLLIPLRDTVAKCCGMSDPDTGPHDLNYGILADRVRATFAEARDSERVILDLIDGRDCCEDWADKLAYSVGGIDLLGEHTNLNDPWTNARELITPYAEVEQLRAELRAARERIATLEGLLQAHGIDEGP